MAFFSRCKSDARRPNFDQPAPYDRECSKQILEMFCARTSVVAFVKYRIVCSGTQKFELLKVRILAKCPNANSPLRPPKSMYYALHERKYMVVLDADTNSGEYQSKTSYDGDRLE